MWVYIDVCVHGGEGCVYIDVCVHGGEGCVYIDVCVHGGEGCVYNDVCVHGDEVCVYIDVCVHGGEVCVYIDVCVHGGEGCVYNDVCVHGGEGCVYNDVCVCSCIPFHCKTSNTACVIQNELFVSRLYYNDHRLELYKINYTKLLVRGDWKTLKAGTTENGNGKGKKSAHAQ